MAAEESRREIVGTALLLSLFTVLLLGALAALGQLDRSYAAAQDQAERCFRALLAPASAPRGAEAELGELSSILARLDRVPVRRELRAARLELGAAWAALAPGGARPGAALDRLASALGRIEGELAVKRDSLSSSFHALIGALALGLFGAIVYVSGLRSRLRLARLEADLRRRGLRASLAAEEELKRGMARELHDDVAQDLAAAKLLCERAAALPGAGAELGAEAASLLGEAGRKLRGLALGLRPPELERAGLAGALEALCSRSPVPGRAPPSFSSSGPLPKVPEAGAIQAYRIVQEALANARKHAPGHRVEVSVAAAGPTEGRDPGLLVSILDRPAPGEAPGAAAGAPAFPEAGPGNDPSVSSGLGLGIMRERAALAGLGLELDIGPAGSSVRLFVPAEAGQGGGR